MGPLLLRDGLAHGDLRSLPHEARDELLLARPEQIRLLCCLGDESIEDCEIVEVIR
jgi:hypothetical protein